MREYHKSRTGRYPTYPPKRFTDKIFYRKINDRRSILTQITDKMQVKDIVGSHAIPTLKDPDYPFIAKPNNYSGKTALIKNDRQWDDFRNRWETLKRKPYGQQKGEWAYKDIEPQLILEPVIKDFWDMKVYLFSGELGCFYVCGKGGLRPERNGISYFWPDGSKIDVIHNGQPSLFNKVPFDFKEALQVARKVTPNIDFVRTDLMVTNKIYVSEFTLYPGSGCISFKPDNFDFELGEKWQDDSCFL